MEVIPSIRPQEARAVVMAVRPSSWAWFSGVVWAWAPCSGSSSSSPVTLVYSWAWVSSACSSSFPLASTIQAEAAPVITATGWDSVMTIFKVVGKRFCTSTWST